VPTFIWDNTPQIPCSTLSAHELRCTEAAAAALHHHRAQKPRDHSQNWKYTVYCNAEVWAIATSNKHKEFSEVWFLRYVRGHTDRHADHNTEYSAPSLRQSKNLQKENILRHKATCTEYHGQQWGMLVCSSACASHTVMHVEWCHKNFPLFFPYQVVCA